VVKFIVRGVDHLLKTEFGLTRGIADTSKIEHTFTEQGKKIKKQVHRVQLLDPATGTGTFLNETIKYIHANYFAGQDGIWEGYVGADLLPRIRGFEILMASYTMAHLKLGLTLAETGWTGDDRVNVFLTNSLEEPHDHIGSLFSQQLAKESEEASKVKKEQPIMIVMGNPPYSVSSGNKGERISSLIADYKKDLNEKKINLDDDYIKFIRYAQHFVDKNHEGMIAFITNNSYIDGITHRQMRKVLMESFDSIYIYDLHGNSKKKETALDGGIDQNVFDIMQGVSIIFAVKKSESKKLASVYHYDSYGKREEKYEHLLQSDVGSIVWTELLPVEPYYFFVPKDFSKTKGYEEGIKLNELFINSTS
jgi:predicted helicase